MGGGESAFEKQKISAKEGLYLFDSKNFKEAKVYFETALKKKPFESVNYVILGEIALHFQEYEKALFFGQSAIRLDNTVSSAHLLMSKGLYYLDEFEESFPIAKKAVWFGRNDSNANAWLGKLYIEKGEIDNGIYHLEIAFSQGDENAGYLIKRTKTKK
jgi:tetratricopeptide (TPR) repeat protein